MQYVLPTVSVLPCSEVTPHRLNFRFLSWELLFLLFLSFWQRKYTTRLDRTLSRPVISSAKEPWLDKPAAITSLEMAFMNEETPLLGRMVSQVRSSACAGTLSSTILSNVSPKEQRLQGTGKLCRPSVSQRVSNAAQSHGYRSSGVPCLRAVSAFSEAKAVKKI